VPQPIIDGFANVDPAAQGALTNVGVDLGDQILASIPVAARPAIEPFIGQVVDGIHQAFSISIANTMWLAVIAAAIAAGLVAVVIPELTLRRTTGAGVAAREPTPQAIAALD
jgi:hypothetical protein